MVVTQEFLRQIQKGLLALSKKDTELPIATTPLSGVEEIAFVQNGHNVKVHIKELVNQLFLLGVSDFLNITDKYNERNISLLQAISLIPYRGRKLGQVITFLNDEGNWVLYQFQGERLNQWNNLTLWVDLIERIAGIASVVPDEEDIHGIQETIGEETKTILKFKDKVYNQDDFSGLGRVYLRKNIVSTVDPNTGGSRKINLLTQQMLSKENTIYIVQYDYSLNNQTLTIPEGSILHFEGGSIYNGILIGTLGGIIDLAYLRYDDLYKFFNYITIKENSTILLEKDKEYTLSDIVNINTVNSNIEIVGNGATIRSTCSKKIHNTLFSINGKSVYNVTNLKISSDNNFIHTIPISIISYPNIQIGDIITLRNSNIKDSFNYFYESVLGVIINIDSNNIYIDTEANFKIITDFTIYRPVKNIKIHDLTFIVNTPNFNAISCNNNYNSELYNLKVLGNGACYGITVSGSNNKVHDCIINEFIDADRVVNMGGYGIYAGGNNCEIYNNNILDCRHCISSASRDFVTTNLHIYDNILGRSNKNLNNLSTTSQNAIINNIIDAHALCNNVIIEGNVINSDNTGCIGVRGNRISIYNNTLNINNTTSTIHIIDAGERANNIIIESNNIFSSAFPCYIKLSSKDTTSSRIDFIIRNNIITRSSIRLGEISSKCNINIDSNIFNPAYSHIIDIEQDNILTDINILDNQITFNSRNNNNIINPRNTYNKFNKAIIKDNILSNVSTIKVLGYENENSVISQDIIEIICNKSESSIVYPLYDNFKQSNNLSNTEKLGNYGNNASLPTKGVLYGDYYVDSVRHNLYTYTKDGWKKQGAIDSLEGNRNYLNMTKQDVGCIWQTTDTKSSYIYTGDEFVGIPHTFMLLRSAAWASNYLVIGRFRNKAVTSYASSNAYISVDFCSGSSSFTSVANIKFSINANGNIKFISGGDNANEVGVGTFTDSDGYINIVLYDSHFTIYPGKIYLTIQDYNGVILPYTNSAFSNEENTIISFKYKGITTSNTRVKGAKVGQLCFDTTINQTIIWDGEVWLDSNGCPAGLYNADGTLKSKVTMIYNDTPNEGGGGEITPDKVYLRVSTNNIKFENYQTSSSIQVESNAPYTIGCV